MSFSRSYNGITAAALLAAIAMLPLEVHAEDVTHGASEATTRAHAGIAGEIRQEVFRYVEAVVFADPTYDASRTRFTCSCSGGGDAIMSEHGTGAHRSIACYVAHFTPHAVESKPEAAVAVDAEGTPADTKPVNDP